MYKQIFITIHIFIFSLFFSGCGSAMSVFDKSGTGYEKGLQYTKVKPLVHNQEPKVLLNATYLNSIDTKKWDDENHNFLIGIYIAKYAQNDTEYLQYKDYSLTLNNTIYIDATLIDKDNEQHKNIPLKNPWAQYYIIKFKKDDKKVLKLKYTNSKVGSVILSFEAE